MQYCILRENGSNKKCNVAFSEKIDQIKSAILHSQLQEREPAVQNRPREEEKLRLHLANRWRGENQAKKKETNKPSYANLKISIFTWKTVGEVKIGLTVNIDPSKKQTDHAMYILRL